MAEPGGALMPSKRNVKPRGSQQPVSVSSQYACHHPVCLAVPGAQAHRERPAYDTGSYQTGKAVTVSSRLTSWLSSRAERCVLYKSPHQSEGAEGSVFFFFKTKLFLSGLGSLSRHDYSFEMEVVSQALCPWLY